MSQTIVRIYQTLIYSIAYREFEFTKRQEIFMQRGFSLVELLIVVLVMMIMLAIGFSFISNYRQLYKPNEQVTQIADILREARQRALTQRRTMRVEINLINRSVRLIDENTNSTTWQDDFEIRKFFLPPEEEVKVAVLIPDISVAPGEVTTTIPLNGCPLSVYPSSSNQNVCTFRFMSNGSVTDQGTDAIGSNASILSATLYVWSPKKTNPNQSEQAYAITVVGGSGFVRMWKYNRSSNRWEFY